MTQVHFTFESEEIQAIINEEIRRRERVIRIFPNTDSVTRIIGTLLIEKDTEWLASPRKYLEFNPNNI